MLQRPRRTGDFDSLFRDVDRLFGEAARTGAFVPRADIVEADDAYVLSLDLPGVARSALRLHYDDGVLTVSGERQLAETHRDARVHRVERHYGRFSRQFALGTAIDPDAIDASLDDGVLTVRVPKAEVRKPRQISIGTRAPELAEAGGSNNVPMSDAHGASGDGAAHEQSHGA